MKKIICAALAGAMVASSVPCLAAEINITIDNEEFIPKNALGEVVEPFIENGSTYLPVRAMGEAVGKNVSFDPENNAVYIGQEPDASAVGKEPVALISGRIYYEEDVEFFGSVDYLPIYQKIVTLAESRFTEDEITAMSQDLNGLYSLYYGELSENVLRYLACAQLLVDSVEVPQDAYSDYVTVKHILVGNKETAQEVLEKIAGNADFDQLIEEYNIDPGQTKDSSYTFTYGEMVQGFEDAAFALEVGEYTKEAVMSEYGYHIIKKLELDKDSVDTEAIRTAVVEKELEGVETGQVVEITRSGDYGVVEGVTITTDMLEVLGGGSGNYSALFEELVMLATLRKACLEADILTPEGKELAEYYIENTSEIDPAGQLNTLTPEQTQFLYSVFAYYYAVDSGEIIPEAESFDFEEVQIDSKVYKNLRVFVDGKLIVPCDVNGNYVKPQNIDGTVYVPVRAIVEALGMSADWDNDTRTVVINK